MRVLGGWDSQQLETKGMSGPSLHLFNPFIPPPLTAPTMPLDLPIATQLCSGGNKEANAIAGVPDLVMRRQQGYALHRITVMLEIKNPWQVTPAGIDQVIRATQSITYRCIISNLLDNNDNRDVPAREVASSRLALEQLYGYMVRNGKTYGVLATVKGWCFFTEKMEVYYISHQCSATFKVDKEFHTAWPMRDTITPKVSPLCKPYIICLLWQRQQTTYPRLRLAAVPAK